MKNSANEQLRKTHTVQAIRQRLKEGVQHSYLKDFIYGAIDGAVTTFAVVAGVTGAQLSNNIILILGLANLLGDGFSMAVSNFLGTRAEEQMREQTKLMEKNHIREIPEGEKEEVRQIFFNKGFRGQELEKAVEVITADKTRWVNTMLQEEFGFPLQGPSALKAGLSTFAAFILIGIIPLLPFLALLLFPSLNFNSFLISSIMTGVAFFSVGAFKASYTGQRWYYAGLETLLIGGSAATLAYLVGYVLKGITG